MRIGIVISLVLHALILGWTLITMATTRDFKKPEVQIVSVEFVSPSDSSTPRKGDEKAKEAEAKAKESQGKAEKDPPKPRVVATTPPPPPAAEPPKPEPAKEEPKPDPIKQMIETPPPPPPEVKPEPPKPEPPKLEPKPEAAEALEAMKQNTPPPPPKPPEPPKPVVQAPPPKPPAPKPKPKPVQVAEAKPPVTPPVPARKPSTFDDQMRKAGLEPGDTPPPPLLNKDPRRSQTARTVAADDPNATANRANGPRDGNSRPSKGEVNQLASQLGGMIRNCYRAQGGNSLAPEDLIVKLQFDLGPDGMLRGEPVVLQPARFSLATEWAVSALKGCQPYRLDADKYQGWKEWDFIFRP